MRWSAHPMRTASNPCAPPSIRCASARWAVRAPVRPARGVGRTGWTRAVEWAWVEPMCFSLT